tara:strand:+ start:3938 stop:4165 length:228 start_codon:yes stop_codon:yes gene_type:complete
MAETRISFSENFADMTYRDMKFFKKGFESSFHLLSQYIRDGVDLDTAKENVKKIMEVESLSINKTSQKVRRKKSR